MSVNGGREPGDDLLFREYGVLPCYSSTSSGLLTFLKYDSWNCPSVRECIHLKGQSQEIFEFCFFMNNPPTGL
jgi:hypothetical protein